MVQLMVRSYTHTHTHTHTHMYMLHTYRRVGLQISVLIWSFSITISMKSARFGQIKSVSQILPKRSNWFLWFFNRFLCDVPAERWGYLVGYLTKLWHWRRGKHLWKHYSQKMFFFCLRILGNVRRSWERCMKEMVPVIENVWIHNTLARIEYS